jgi:hypothetical protein
MSLQRTEGRELKSTLRLAALPAISITLLAVYTLALFRLI